MAPKVINAVSPNAATTCDRSKLQITVYGHSDPSTPGPTMSESASSGICPVDNLLHLAWSKLLSQFPIFGQRIGGARQSSEQQR
jgi:hypothetical protein